MAIRFERTAFPGDMDPFWRKEVKMLPGGFSMKQTFTVGDVIRRGSFLYVDMSDLSAAVVKIGKVQEGGTTSAARVSKKNNFCVGDVVYKVGVEEVSATTTVKSIDTSNPDYDVITFASAITGLVAGDFIQEFDSSTKKPKYVANAVLGADLEIKKSGIFTLDAAYDAIVLKSVCTPFPESWLVENGFCLATNHNILFINQ